MEVDCFNSNWKSPAPDHNTVSLRGSDDQRLNIIILMCNYEVFFLTGMNFFLAWLS